MGYKNITYKNITYKNINYKNINRYAVQIKVLCFL